MSPSLMRILHVHQAADVERQGERLRSGAPARRCVSGDSERGGSEQAESPEWMPASSICSMMPADEDVLAVGEAVDVDLDGVRQIAVEQQRVLAEHRVDLAGLVVGVARLDVGAAPGPAACRADSRRSAPSSRMIAMARPPST